MLREDLSYDLRQLAVREKRKLYEVMEEALEQELERRQYRTELMTTRLTKL
jgi:predicted transcriptional regulator